MKLRWTPERLATAQPRSVWPSELRANRLHPKDQPGIYLDKGVWVDQLRYHDPEGLLAGRSETSS